MFFRCCRFEGLNSKTYQKEIWNDHLDEKLDADTTLVLEEIFVTIKESVQVPAPHCPKCESCSPCEKPEPCPKHKPCPEPKTCPECQVCEKCNQESLIENNQKIAEETREDIAIRLLKTNWEDASDVPADAKDVDFVDIPVINNFGSFQRDAEDYNISRAGYEPRRLVCDELSEHLPKVQTRHWIDDCDDVPKYPDDVLSFINLGVEKSVIDKIEDAGLKSTDKNISTPYVLLAFDLYDFDAEDANLMRMVREAEAQNADIISGSSVDENGHWLSNCGHIHVSNYTLDIWDGYYKSIRSIMHCDVGSGPVVVRKELLEEITEDETERLAKWPDRLEVLLKLNDRVRFVHCPDCMFYQKESKVDRKNFIRLSRMFKLTNFNIDSNKDNYEFTCNEANIQCSTSAYQNKALAQAWFFRNRYFERKLELIKNLKTATLLLDIFDWNGDGSCRRIRKAQA
ncbi:Oidioi.mRNA.OKI2018_I69.chr2.g8250.t1.cds [Oikopleura dioica]|uniref:Oidioi.mRNA.OKI2018_I69.chr2.g8250.t1.cds n=1 Tax=Oikopleura dioica TaxID=34765 RepID=A0ABN7T8N9_OIKDI|nr:Oidioi.mRNA.OKI2018_I69.chr2.g8250.t1.cds [Oikopleura dioica]